MFPIEALTHNYTRATKYSKVQDNFEVLHGGLLASFVISVA